MLEHSLSKKWDHYESISLSRNRQTRREEKPKPVRQEATDAIAGITKTTICGADLHLMKGDVPDVPDGLTLGYEGVGIIAEAGIEVANFKVGDQVLISCITSCGR